jgi:hypothetical protein
MKLIFRIGNFSPLSLINNGRRVDNFLAEKIDEGYQYGASFEDLVEIDFIGENES